MQRLSKKATPHVPIKDKGDADLYFNFLDIDERKELFRDLIGEDQPTIELPNFGKVTPEGPIIQNEEVHEFSEKDLSQYSEDMIKRFVRDRRITTKPFLEYDDEKHKYELKPKYDIERMLKEITQKQPALATAK